MKEKLKEQSEYEKDQEEVQTLSKDIEHLKTVNGEKVFEIEKISRINKNLTAQLDVLHNEKKEDPNCLDDELGPHFSRTFKCKECEKYFATHQLLRSHMKNDHGSNHQISTIKFKLHELELQILEQKLDITQKISKLKEAEQTCSCAGWCAINHQKHSWSKSSSKELSFKLQKLSNESVPDEMQTFVKKLLQMLAICKPTWKCMSRSFKV